LREEIEFAHDMNERLSGFYSPGGSMMNRPDPLEQLPPPPPPPPPRPPPAATTTTTTTTTPSKRGMADPPESGKPSAYTLQDHADFLRLGTEKVGGWYYCDMSPFLLPSESTCEDLVKDYCLPVPFRKMKRLYSGLHYHEVSHAKLPATPAKTPIKGQSTPSTHPYQTNPSTPGTPLSARRPPMPPTTPATPAPQTPSSAPSPQEEPLPARTVAIRIRPDVLCGAVMDAVHHAFETLPNNCTTHVLKRQGGHLRGAVFFPSKSLAYVADAQLCTQNNDLFERRLVVRFYHIQDDPLALSELGQVLQHKVPPSPGLEEEIPKVMEDDKLSANRHLKISCSLIQRLMASQQEGGSRKMDHKQQSSWLGLRDTAFETKSAMQWAIGNHLESNFKACPSVREENKKACPTIRRLTLPSLSSKDWPLLDASWSLTSSILDELDTRDCTYNTISTLPFGQFPSLPTLDVHYCSQLRRLSRESMISHLLKSAKELEDYAKTAEYNCAICITVLKPMVRFYRIPPLELPNTSKALQEYALDYEPPQVSCPPWGSLVMEALNKVAARSPTEEITVDEAVRLVYQAFMRQDDEEQAARLGRKNAQIMERLASMQSHQRQLIHNIRDSHVYSEKASSEANEYLKRQRAAINIGQAAFPRVMHAEVPLLSFRISTGASSSGTCYVTPTQILFSTKYIPIVGGKHTLAFDLSLVNFQVDESLTSTLLNPFPNTISILVKNSTQDPVFSFRPSIGPSRLHTFLKVIQAFADEDMPTEFTQVDRVTVADLLNEAPSEDQMSV
jgi:hypothetical protein